MREGVGGERRKKGEEKEKGREGRDGVREGRKVEKKKTERE